MILRFFSIYWTRQYITLWFFMSLALRHIKYNEKKKILHKWPNWRHISVSNDTKKIPKLYCYMNNTMVTCVQIKMSNFVWRAVKYCRTILVCLLCPLWFKSLLGCCASIFGILTLNVAILYKVVSVGLMYSNNACLLYYHVLCLTLTKHHIVQNSKVKFLFRIYFNFLAT